MSKHFEIEVLEETKHPLFIERKEIWKNESFGPDTEMHNGYAHDGSFIGTVVEAKHLAEKYGIKPERRSPEKDVASVGYSEKEGKWFGWSHRAISSYDTRDEAAQFAESVS